MTQRTTAPTRRIWLYQPTQREPVLEIVVLGDVEDIAPFMTELRRRLDDWPGFSDLETLVMGEQQVGFLVTRTRYAQHDDPIAEAMHMCKRMPIDWCPTAGAGMVGIW